MKVLGIHFTHDAAAALVVDGQIIAAAAEERFNRVKHYGYLPIQALRWCLQAGQVSMEDIDYIAVTASLLSPALHLLLQLNEDEVVKAAKANGVSLWSRENLMRLLRRRVSLPQVPPEYISFFKKAPRTPLIQVDHHTAHAASACYTSGFNSGCLAITTDGIGDGVSLAVWKMENGRLQALTRVDGTGSFGWFYGLVTEALGWWVGDGEGKTMGLAPYGNPEGFPDAPLAQFIPHYEDGRLVKPVNYGRIGLVRLHDTSHWHFPDAPKVKALIDQYGKEDVAAKAQKLLEEEMLPIVGYWVQREKAKDLATAGGVFLNVKMNQKIVEKELVERFHIFPDAGDAGLAVGAALYVYYDKSRETHTQPLRHVYWGPSYSPTEIESILKLRNLKFRRSANIAGETAELLAQGRIVGWFQGRMEVGPRALGNRSILMDPRRPENKDIINLRVKYREPFRPFCPSLTKEGAHRYLRLSRDEKFMICAYAATEQAAKETPAVVHVDNTVRPQIVGEENPKFEAVIREFGRLTGVPAILNTSFNIKGEPIICSPSDAIKCFFDTGMDVLVLDDFLVSKG